VFSLLVGFLSQIHDTYFLVAIMDNDYVDSNLFAIFDEIIKCDQELRSGSDSDRGRKESVNSDSATTWF
jgi:hypothetical protein